MSNYNSIEAELGRLNNRIGSLSINAGTLSTNASFAGTLNVGAVSLIGGTLNALQGTVDVNLVGGVLTGANPSDGTLTQLGTLFYVETVKQVGTLPNINVGSGTLQTLNAGTLQYVGAIGTIPSVTGTVGVNQGTLNQVNTVTQVGTLPNVIVGSGTLQQITYIPTIGLIGTMPAISVGNASGGTIDLLRTVNSVGTLSGGTLQYVGAIGTLPNVVVGSGTLQTVGAITNAVTVTWGVGTVTLTNGTVAVSSLPTISLINSVGTLSSGSLQYVGNVGTLPNVVVGSGTLQEVTFIDTIKQIGTMPAISIGNFTGGTQDLIRVVNSVGTLNSGTLQYIGSIGTLPNIVVGSGTLAISSMPAITAINSVGTLTSGTLQYVGSIGTLPNVIVGSGTVAISNPQTTVDVTNGTLNVVTQIGTLPNIIVGSGTLQMLNAGTLTTLGSITNAVTVTWGVGTVAVANGTVVVSSLPAIASINSVGTLNSGTLQYVGSIGTLPSITGLVGVSDGTLMTVTKIGTLPNIVVGSGTLQSISGNVNVIPIGSGTVNIASQPNNVIASGTLQQINIIPTVTQIGTLPNIVVGSGTLDEVTVKQIGTLPPITGTVQISNGTVAISSLPSITVGTMPTTTVQWSNQTLGISDGTLRTVTQIGTLPNIVIGSGTLQAISGALTLGGLGTVRVDSGTITVSNPQTTVGITDGTLRTVTQVGTLPNIVIGSGTLQTLNSGTLQSIVNQIKANILQVASEDIQVAGGSEAKSIRVTLANDSTGVLYKVGTLDNLGTIGKIGTLPPVIISSGSLQYVGNVGTLPPVTGTVQIGNGTITVSSLPNVTVTSMPTTTVQWSNQTIGISDGTQTLLGTLTKIGTLPTLENMGTLFYQNNLGTLYAISQNVNVIDVGLGTTKISDGTVKIDLTTVPSGTLKVNVVAGGAGGGVAQTQVMNSAGNWENVGLGTYRTMPISGTVEATFGAATVGVTDGTLRTVTQIGTLPPVIVNSGTLNSQLYVKDSGTLGLFEPIGYGTFSPMPILGTISNIGTLPNIIVGSGTLNTVTAITNAVTVTWGLGTTNPTAGTLDTVTRIGTLPNVVVGSGTLQMLNAGTLTTLGAITNAVTVTWGIGTVTLNNGSVVVTSMPAIPAINSVGTLSSGTLQYLGNVGTLPNIIVGSGTLQMLNGGTINTIDKGTITTVSTVTTITNNVNVVPVGLGTILVGSGTINTIPQSGTLQAVTSITNIAGFSATVGTLGTLSSLTSCGSATTFSKHDLHLYDNVGTWLTASGTAIPAVASKVIKVHYYSLQTDGSVCAAFYDAGLLRSKLGQVWSLNQREGAVSAFLPYPAYHFKTTVGSALALGTQICVTWIGTLHFHIVYTDDDAT